jgi:Domain of unknown function (DUF4263)
MPKQSFDHSEFIAGSLHRHQQVGWAQQVTLDQGARSLWLMQAKHIEHSDGRRGFALQIQKYAKATNKARFSEPEISFELSEQSVRTLFDYLQCQQALGEVDLGSDYIAIPVLAKGTLLLSKQVDSAAALFRALIQSNQLQDVLTSQRFTKALVENIGAAAQHVRYKTAVADLRRLLATEKREQAYQDWFEEHPWICGINYVGRVDIRRIGLHQITDVVMKTTDGYLDLIELKRPDSPVLRLDQDRNLFYFSTEASQSVAQAAAYVTTTEENRHMLGQTEKLLFLKPRARIVIGRSDTWKQPHRNALRILNASLHFIEVWTYDDILAMADQLVRLYERSEEDSTHTHKSPDDSEIPF